MLAKASLVKPALPAPPRVVADASRCDLRAAPDASAADLRVLPHVVACLQSAPQHPMAAQRPTLRHRQLLVRARRELSASTSLPLQSQTFATPSSVAGQEHRNIHEHRSSIGRSRDIRSGTQGSDQLGIDLGSEAILVPARSGASLTSEKRKMNSGLLIEPDSVKS
jgi:hypothetical protein